MTKEKNNKIFLDKQVTLIVTIVALVGIIALVFELGKRLAGQDDCYPDDFENTFQVDTSDNNSIPYFDIFDNKQLYNIYSVNYNEGSYLIIGYNNKIYYINSVSMSDVFSCTNEFVVNGEGSRITRNGKNYICEGENEEDYGANIVELDINPGDVKKIIVNEYPLSTDAQYAIFFIHNDGIVDYYHADGLEGTLQINAFKGYKIVTLGQKCIKNSEYGCKKTELTLKLKDGNIKKITNFDFK